MDNSNPPASAVLPESMPDELADFLPGSAAVGDDRMQYVRDVLQDQGDLLQGRVMTALQAEFNSFQESVCAFIALQIGDNGLMMNSQQLACVSMEEEEEAASATSGESSVEQTTRIKDDETTTTMIKLITLIGMFASASTILRSVSAQ